MALSTTQYGYIIDPMVPFTDGKGNTIKDGFVRVFVAGSSTPVITYRNFDGAANQDLIELDNSGRTKTSVIGSKGITYKVCVYDQMHSQESPILTVDKVSVIGANITAGAGATVVTGLDGLTTKPDGFVDASVVGTDGYVALDHTLVEDDLDTDAKVTAVEDDRYVPLLNDDVNDPDSKMTLGRLWQWVLGKISNIATTATEADLKAGNYFALDGEDGTKKLPAEVVAKQRDIGLIEGSIPSDHFKTKLGIYPLSVYSTVHGYIHRTNGNFFETDLDIYAKVFAVNYGDVLNLETTLPNNAFCGQYAFYGENMEVLTPDPIDTVPNEHVTYNGIKAPLGAKYLYVACGSADAVVSCSRDFYAELDTDNLLYTDKDIVFSPGTVRGGYINRTTGAFSTSNEYFVRVFDVAPGLSVNISTTLPANITCGQYAFYGENMEVLTPDPIDGTDTVTNVEYNSVEVPNGARYLYVSCASSDYESRVYIRQPSTKVLEESIFADFTKSQKINIVSSAGYRGYINRANGSYNPSYDGDFYVQVFAVPSYSTSLEIKTKTPANVFCGQYAFYGENMEVLTPNPIDGTATSQNVVYESVRVPDGAKYLYVSCVTIDYAVEVNDVSFIDFKNAKKSAYSVTDIDLTTDRVVVGKTSNIKNNYEMFAHFTFTAFSGIRIWKGNNSTYRSAYIDISNSKITVTQNGVQTHDVSHGLTITDYLQVLVEVGKMREAKITLFTGNDQTFELDIADFYAHGTMEIVGNNYGYHIESAAVTYRDLLPNNGIRVYGDSFFQIDDDRWPYYVYKRNGKFALNSLPGSAAAVMYQQVLYDIAIAGYPDIIVWGDGQNESSDTNEDTPNGTWLDYVQQLISLLDGKTELVLCTTPSTETKLHNGICKWVRNSGFRYIDLSAAVAASDTDRNWKPGMQGSGSNASHPTAYGARAMADRAIIDLPELVDD